MWLELIGDYPLNSDRFKRSCLGFPEKVRKEIGLYKYNNNPLQEGEFPEL